MGRPLSTFALDRVSAHLPEAVAERYVDRAGGAWAVIHAQHLPAVVAFLKNDPELNFKLFVSADGVDRLHLAENDPRFEVVYFLRSLTLNEHVRLKVRVTETNPEVPSLVPLFKGANWWERFVWDFYGIRFTGHPDLRRILMYEEFQGHPLRKDYALRDRQPLIPERPIKDIFRGPGTSGHS
ncbi:NADH-quinone oxidoreductase chain 5 [Stigmatella aurantiaca DW4/3-1]|uniref:NADH-quinone oxidoreductase subunit C n=1 Tax=Stigmatella aurantiaca (strain DW4/3-1) TaxID=378806 RepID=Q08SQ7_STIAD|nr:NADH-quinone oxidoreductase chain 5 [Stigmatella aurantiaca DW4/3-1]